MNLDTIIYNDVTLGQLLPWIVAVVVVYATFRIYKALFGKKKVNLQHTVYFACSNCGWEGHISKFGTRCPKCDAPAGDLSPGS
jgi:Zn finger protein HypA/HybF involved in hydrogenase expression